MLKEAGTFSGQALLLSYPYRLTGGGGRAQEAGTHSQPCQQYLPNIQPHTMHQIRNGSLLIAKYFHDEL